MGTRSGQRRRRPRVLIVTPDYPPGGGGIPNLMARLAENLAVTSLRVVTLDSGGAQQYDEHHHVDVIRVRLAAGHHPLRIATLSARAAVEAIKFKPDVALVGHVAAAPAGAVLRRLLRIPVVTYVHADEFRVWPRRCAFAMSHSDAVIAVSRHTERLAVSGGADPGQVHRIYHGVEMPSEDRGHAARDGEPPTILTVARMDEFYKGHDVMLRAMPLVLARVPSARWVVLGDGLLRPFYEQIVDSLGIGSAVSFHGRLDDAERDDWFRRAHVFAMPARVPPGGAGGEGFGLAYLEAAAFRLPVVAANEGGALDAVDAGRTGLLIDPTDHVALADALAGLLTDADGARAMGDHGFEWATGFPWQKTAIEVADVLRVASGCEPVR